MTTSVDHILFPTDFSDSSRNALSYALAVAKKTGAILHILHSIEEAYDISLVTPEVHKGINSKVEELFDNLVDEIREKYSDIPLETHIQNGRAAFTIMEEAQNREADLIVMGSKGRGGIQKFLVGNTTRELFQRSDVPVLAVPEQQTYSGFDKILFTTAYQDEDLNALEYVVELAKVFDSRVTVFHASEDSGLRSRILSRGFKEMARDTIDYEHLAFEKEDSISFMEAVHSKIQKETTSLLTMVHYQNRFAPFEKNYTKEMSEDIKVPLLVLPGKSRVEKEG